MTTPAAKRIPNLRAKTHCGGKRVDLTWEDPVDGAPSGLRIIRSPLSFALRSDDQGEIIYDDRWINAFTDGLNSADAYANNSGEALEENRFYYYTLFYRDGSDPLRTNEDAQVTGLSIRDYNAIYGHYVYSLLPRALRDGDASSENGRKPYTLRDYCSVLQCAVNLYRGWFEGLLHLKNPELAPAGKIGVPQDQTGFLEAALQDLGFPAEKSFDNGVLRRLAFGMMDVYRLKGTCAGLVLFTSLFTKWTSRCDDAVDPECGVSSMFTSWDGSAYKVGLLEGQNGDCTGAALAYTTDDEQTFTVPTSALYDPFFSAASDVPDSTDSPSVSFIIDAMGSWCCVQEVDHPTALTRTFTVRKGFLRRSLHCQGVAGVGEYTIQTVNNADAPWQYASASGTGILKWGPSAWKNYKVKDSAGDLFDVLDSSSTDNAGETVLTLSGNPAAGDIELAYAFDGNDDPILRAVLYVGIHSLVLSPRWDYRLAGSLEPGPFNAILTMAGASDVFGALLSPGDVTIIVKGIGAGKPAASAGTATGVTASTLTDSSASWTNDQWEDYYLLPNWNQTKVFRVTGNTATVLTVATPNGDVDTVAEVGSSYVLLTEENALKYVRLIQLGLQLVPDGTRIFVKFEN